MTPKVRKKKPRAVWFRVNDDGCPINGNSGHTRKSIEWLNIGATPKLRLVKYVPVPQQPRPRRKGKK
jgi:hypothetical protein